MSAATLIFAADSPTPRQTLAFSLSLLLHLTLGFVFLMSIRREVPSKPLEISIFEGPTGLDSPPGGKEGGEPRPAPSAEQAKPLEAAKAPPASRVGAPPVKLVARLHRAQRTIHAEQRVEEKSLPVALKTSDPASTVQVPENLRPSVAAGEAPSEDAAPVPLDTGPTRPQVAVAGGDPKVSRSVERSVGPAVQPDSGRSSWTPDGAGAGRGGTEHGSFSVSGAGAGGASRSYASIWEWTQRYLSGLRMAYSNALRNDSALRGIIVVRYEILGSGAVGEVAMVSSQLRDPHFEEEVLNQIHRWHYAFEPTGTVVVTWPLSFLPPS